MCEVSVCECPVFLDVRCVFECMCGVCVQVRVGK